MRWKAVNCHHRCNIADAGRALDVRGTRRAAGLQSSVVRTEDRRRLRAAETGQDRRQLPARKHASRYNRRFVAAQGSSPCSHRNVQHPPQGHRLSMSSEPLWASAFVPEQSTIQKLADRHGQNLAWGCRLNFPGGRGDMFSWGKTKKLCNSKLGAKFVQRVSVW